MFDHPVFKMSFLFLLIIVVTIFLLGVAGYYEDDQAQADQGALQRFFKFQNVE